MATMISTILGEIPKPEVGMGATIYLYSDRKAATVIAVSANGKKVTVQMDKATRVAAYMVGDPPAYKYERDPQGQVMEFSLRKNGRFVLVGDSATGGLFVKFGARREYYDRHF